MRSQNEDAVIHILSRRDALGYEAVIGVILKRHRQLVEKAILKLAAEGEIGIGLDRKLYLLKKGLVRNPFRNRRGNS